MSLAILRFLLLGLLLAGGRPAAAGRLVEDQTIVHDGLTRWFDYYEPSGLPSTPVPLLFVIHGGTGSNKTTTGGVMGEFKFIAELEKFIVIYPNATSPDTGQSGPSGNFVWNDCRQDAGPAQTTADDVGFISQLIDWAAARWNIDPERVYSTGGSNGGLMSYRLAFELSDRIAAIAAIIANLPIANSECPSRPPNPISVMVMDGTADGLMPWDGGDVVGERGQVISALETRDFWRGFLSTANPPRVRTFPDVDPDDGGDVQEQIYCSGTGGTQVAFYRVNGAGHTFPSRTIDIGDFLQSALGKQNHDVETSLLVWRFLERQRLSGTPGPCGDGCIDAGEVCDDGNTADGDCCNSTCSEGAACNACEVCDPVTRSCTAQVQTTCSTSTSGTMLLRDAARAGGDRVRWRWRGADVLPTELGDPTAADDLTMCVFDADRRALVATVLQAGGRCSGAKCWKRLKAGGAVFQDPNHTRSPIARALLRAGNASSAKIVVSGRGPGLRVPPLSPLALPLRVQLTSTAGGCWQAFCAAPATKRGRYVSTCAGSPSGAFLEP